MISIGILAGGKSTRMGQDKAFLMFKGKTLLQTVLDAFSAYDDVRISAREAARFASFGKPVVCDQTDACGAIAGVYQLLVHATHEYVFICPVDAPFVSSAFVSFLFSYMTDQTDCVCVEQDGKTHPLCALYARRVAPVVADHIARKQYRLTDLLLRIATKKISLAHTVFGARPLCNLNTSQDVLRAQKPLVFCVSGCKHAGKTTLITRLIPRFMRDGFSVAVIKHDGHDYCMDRHGTDTYAFSSAGAQKSLIFSDTQFSLNAKGAVTIDTLLSFCTEDVVIIEGLKQSMFPKIVLTRHADVSLDGVRQVIAQFGADYDEAAVYRAVLAYFGAGLWNS